jgi:cellulose 1,4-beta-cellobiosidase
VRVTAGSVTDQQLALTWALPAANAVNRADLASLKVQAAVVTGGVVGAFNDVVSGLAITATGTPVTGLTNGTTYQFRVQSVGTNNAGSTPSLVSANTATASLATGRPAVTAGSTTATSVALTWAASAYPADVAGLAVQYGTSATGPWTTATTSAALTSASLGATVTGLSSGTTLYFSVLATGTGTVGNATSTTSAAVTTAPAQPTVSYSTTTGQATVNWTAVAGATGYTLQYSANGGAFANVGAAGAGGVSLVANLTGASSTANVTGLAGNTTYVFQVRANVATGNSPYSVASTPAVLSLPAAPAGVAAANGSAGAPITGGLTWTTVAGVTYNVMYGTAAQLAANTGTVVTDVTSGTQITVPAAGAISMKVQAVNATGTSAWSATRTVTAL